MLQHQSRGFAKHNTKLNVIIVEKSPPSIITNFQ